MKLYVLTHCAAMENYTPEVFTTKEAAIKRMRAIYKNCIGDGNSVDTDELYTTSAEIIYVDNTYNRLDIFEVEVKEE